jgi:hypothetical protein
LKELHNQQLEVSVFQANSNFFFPKVSTWNPLQIYLIGFLQ